MPEFHELICTWQKSEGRRDLPWQSRLNGVLEPYKVWVSEVMLQQTQVSTVIPYFEAFLERFPNVYDLALASESDVFSMWSGLGFYRRASMLHACAKQIVQEWGGEFPKEVDALLSLPGIGPNTAAAIASFCWLDRVSILDGNVQRVLTRVLGWDVDTSSSQGLKELKKVADGMVPSRPEDMPAYTQGLMDLGALVCRPKVLSCDRCPVASCCVGLKSGMAEDLPVKSKRSAKKLSMENDWFWAFSVDRVLLQRRPSKGIWSNLWTAPLLSPGEGAKLAERHALLLLMGQRFKHVLTHRDWWLQPMACTVDAPVSDELLEDSVLEGAQWVNLNEALRLGVSGPTRDRLLCWSQENRHFS